MLIDEYSKIVMILNCYFRWSAWFWFNSLCPGRAEYNHQSQRELAYFSLKYGFQRYIKVDQLNIGRMFLVPCRK